MNIWKSLLAGVLVCSLVGLSAMAADKKPKLTCCQEAAATKQDCKHKCCITAHRAGKSCEKCNPNQEDLKKDKKK